ncbi:MAG: hypothetical protein LBC65_06385 [Oscillospiraceae bacterium]|jgi:uncharacterized membrane protein YjfL (UPF0719 family)|nr:hypothetical protein [Oscillospiraceae bacterium]
MFYIEIAVIVLATLVTVGFLLRWYDSIIKMWPTNRGTLSRGVLGALPLVAFALIILTLHFFTIVSFENNVQDVFMYIALGFTAINFGMSVLSSTFDLSWLDDALLLDNRAALPAVSGAFMGFTLIYCGANIGKHTDWWQVAMPGVLAFAIFVVLGLIFNQFTLAVERVTVERDSACGVRLGAYLLACGVLLARAAAGDWLKPVATLIGFSDAWPTVPLTVFAILVEKLHVSRVHRDPERDPSTLRNAAFWSGLYLFIAIAMILYFVGPPAKSPLTEFML